MTVSTELGQFFQDYYLTTLVPIQPSWLNPQCGLCYNLGNWYKTRPQPSRPYWELDLELMELLIDEGLHTVLPFNRTDDVANYNNEWDKRDNPYRMAFVKRHMLPLPEEIA